jgi:hypothetical protein
MCSWHYACASDPRSAQDEEAFRQWLASRTTCSLWRHYTEPYLWARVLGRQGPAVPPTRCDRFNCAVLLTRADDPSTAPVIAHEPEQVEAPL